MRLHILQTGQDREQITHCSVSLIHNLEKIDRTRPQTGQLASKCMQMNEFKLRPMHFCQKKGVFNSDHSSYYCKLKHIFAIQ